jgi:cytochrome P450
MMTDAGASPAGEIVYNPFSPEVKVNPYPVYRRLREHDPLHFNKYAGMWFLTRHRDCAAILRDARFSAALGQDVRRRGERLPPSMLNTDPPDHARLRDPFMPLFANRVLQQLRPRIQAIVDDLLTQPVDQGAMEVIGEFAGPLAARVLAAKLDVPAADLDQFHAWARQSAVILDPLAPPQAQQAGIPAAIALQRYFAERAAAPQPDPAGFLARLLAVADQPETITRDEVLNACTLIVIGGYEPLVHLIGNGLLVLHNHPAERARLREDPALIKSAVEELLRYESPIQFTARVAREDVDLDGRRIRGGQTVVALFGAANRDPAVFADPDRLDLGRAPNPHLGFGAGPHFCLGAPLVRLGAEVALGTLVQRFPHLRLTAETPQWRNSTIPRGLEALPVALA